MWMRCDECGDVKDHQIAEACHCGSSSFKTCGFETTKAGGNQA
jgi:hypothetical protein